MAPKWLVNGVVYGIGFTTLLLSPLILLIPSFIKVSTTIDIVDTCTATETK